MRLCEDDHGRSFHSYELNLILRDGKRAQVLEHPYRDAVLDLAKETARFVGVPLWDASDVDAPVPTPDRFTRSMRVVGRVVGRVLAR